MILDDLAVTHTVVGPDYPGAGQTPRSEAPLDLDEVTDTLVRTAVDVGVESFAILGYSLGTGVAVRAATRHPERVTGLILTVGSAYPDNRLRLAAEVWRALLEFGDRTLLAKFLTYAGTGDKYLTALSEPDLAASIAQLAELIPAGSPEHVDLVRHVDTRAELAGIAVCFRSYLPAQGGPAAGHLAGINPAPCPPFRVYRVVEGHQEASGGAAPLRGAADAVWAL